MLQLLQFSLSPRLGGEGRGEEGGGKHPHI